MRSWGIGLALLVGATACSSGNDGYKVEMQPFQDDARDASALSDLLPSELPTLPPIEQHGPDAMVVPHESADDAAVIDVGLTDAALAEDAMTSDADAGQPERIELSELRVSGTPTNSIRMGAWGYDPQHGLCIMVVWYLERLDETRFCTYEPDFDVPYVVIEAMEDPVVSDPSWQTTNPPCWEYSGNVTVLEQRGCADFGNLSDPNEYAIDAEIDVAGDAFTGTIHLLH